MGAGVIEATSQKSSPGHGILILLSILNAVKPIEYLLEGFGMQQLVVFFVGNYRQRLLQGVLRSLD